LFIEQEADTGMDVW